MSWTPCYSFRVRSGHEMPTFLPTAALRELRMRLGILKANRCINGWAPRHPLWEDETHVVVRLRFPDDQSAACFALMMNAPLTHL
jgi:hypothetical protein